MRRITRWQQAATQAGLVLVALFVLVPVWGLVRLALDGAIKGAPTDFRIWPEQFTLDVLRQVLEQPSQSLGVPGLLRNSLTVAGGAALSSIALGASMAYAFARFRFPARRTGLFALLIGALLPPVALMTPLYILLSALQLRTSLLGLMIIYAAFSMPFCVWNMRSAFQSVPRELEEAAFLDGATLLAAFWRVTLPLALPAIAVAGLIGFLIGYTEFAIGWLFVESSANVTLAMAVSGMQGQTGAWSKQAALALLMSLPVVAIFFLLQRYLLQGLLIGVGQD
jgi:arabinogalactan oligomer/maltooligosaccharide transport system permease protein